jgi:type I restriction enzyme S subunit
MSDQELPIPNRAGWPQATIAEISEFVARGTAPVYVESSDVLAIGQRCVTEGGFNASFARPHDRRRMRGILAPRPGDVFVNSTGTGTIGRSCVYGSSGRFIVDGHVTVIRPRLGSADGRWIEALIRSPWGQTFLEGQCYSGSTNQVELSRGRLSQTLIPFPDISEQRRIAEILETADEAIRSTERVIAKLEQAKQGLLYDLLSPCGPVPTRWNGCHLGELVDQARPIVYGILMPGKGWRNGVPVVKVKDIQGGIIQQDDLLLTSPSIDEKYQRSRIHPGDLLFTIRGTVGRMAFVPSTLAGANITQDTARISITKADKRFVWYYLQMPAPQSFVDLHTLGQAVKGINLRDVRRIPISLPPIEEQRRIAESLDVATERIRYEVAQAGLLRSVRRGLMDDLLTGRVRVGA